MLWAFEAAACGRERRKERVERRCFGGRQLGVRRRPAFSHAVMRGEFGLAYGTTWRRPPGLRGSVVRDGVVCEM
jgi:hypothetical protein